MDRPESAAALADRELIARYVSRVIVTPRALEICFHPASGAAPQVDASTLDCPTACNPLTTVTLPWTAPSFAAVKGIIHEPSEKPAMKPESRDVLLPAIVKARKWIDDIRLGRLASFAEIAEREAVGERHIRLLAPLAFLSPRVIAAIAEGTAPADLTVTGLAKALPYSWAEQERGIGLHL
jgi:site-specific DNA recombinase